MQENITFLNDTQHFDKAENLEQQIENLISNLVINFTAESYDSKNLQTVWYRSEGRVMPL